jgi:hypothetical protein
MYSRDLTLKPLDKSKVAFQLHFTQAIEAKPRSMREGKHAGRCRLWRREMSAINLSFLLLIPFNGGTVRRSFC